MNIGIDIRSLMSPVRTGVGEYTYELLTAVFSLDTENHYYLFYNSYRDVSPYVPTWSNRNVHLVVTHWPNKLFTASQRLFGFPRIDSLIKAKSGKLDIFFSPNLHFTSLTSATKSILTIHDVSFVLFPDCYSPKMRLWHRFLSPERQIERTNIILTPSVNTKRDIVEHYHVPEARVRVLYPGLSSIFSQPSVVTPDQIREKYRLPAKFILFLGTLEPRKNIVGLIEAWRGLRLPYDLVIAGAAGWNRGEITHRINQTPGVRTIGYVSPEDKPILYRLASLFVFPSLYEGFGFPVLEAMASGTPVITSNRSSLPEVVGRAAYLVNPYNTSEITEGMKLLLTDEKLRAWYIERGVAQAKKFNWQSSARDFLQIISTL